MIGEMFDDLRDAICEGAEFGIMLAVAVLAFLGVIGALIGFMVVVVKMLG